MNNCILMAEIIKDPELRYTTDQMAIAEMLVQFPGTRPDDPAGTLRAVGFGNLASEIQQTYRVGDRVIVEGRLGMLSVDRPEGFKEKRAELRLSRVTLVRSLLDGPLSAPASSGPAGSAPMARSAASRPPAPAPAPRPAPAPAPIAPPPVDEALDYDEIPF